MTEMIAHEIGMDKMEATSVIPEKLGTSVHETCNNYKALMGDSDDDGAVQTSRP